MPVRGVPHDEARQPHRLRIAEEAQLDDLSRRGSSRRTTTSARGLAAAGPPYTDAHAHAGAGRLERGRGGARRVEDGVLDALRERLGCTIALRGNRLTLGGDDKHVSAARAVVEELVELVEDGHQIGPDTVGAVLAALDQAEDVRDVFEDVARRHRGKKIASKTANQKRYVDAIRAHGDVRGRPGGHRQDVLAMALAVSAPSGGLGRADHPHAARRRGGRAARFPARRHAREGRPLSAAAYDALYDMLEAERSSTWMRDDRGRPARVHARPQLNDSFVVLDEAQNTTPEQMQMFLTRLGLGRRWSSPAT